MRLKNRKTGEIGELSIDCKSCSERNLYVIANRKYEYVTLASLFDEWEDYEEPKAYWYIDDAGVMQVDQILSSKINMRKSIGNYFETKKEAEKAVEKLNAWKRLKDNGFTIRQWQHIPDMNLTTGSFITIRGFIPEVMKNIDDLDLLFGGEDD